MPMIIKSRLAPRRMCLNLFGTLWVRDPSWINDRIINHERIHTAQQREMLFVPFYLVYVIEWLIRFALCRSWVKAYYDTSFEREAYSNGDDLGYLAHRRHYAWLRRIRS